MPNKGKTNRRTYMNNRQKYKSPFMTALIYHYRIPPIIVTVPLLPPVKKPPLFILPSKVVLFQKNISNLNHTNDTKLWKVDYCQCILSILNPQKTRTQQYTTLPKSITGLDHHAKSLSFHLIAHHPHFLQYKIPPSCHNLMPGTHWIWTALSKKGERNSGYYDNKQTFL